MNYDEFFKTMQQIAKIHKYSTLIGNCIECDHVITGVYDDKLKKKYIPTPNHVVCCGDCGAILILNGKLELEKFGEKHLAKMTDDEKIEIFQMKKQVDDMRRTRDDITEKIKNQQ